STRPVEGLDLLLWGDLKTMFEPHVEDNVWRQQQGYKVLNWKLYDSCGVHSLMLQCAQIYMPVEKKYPLTPPTLSQMLEKKLSIDYESEMAYQLCCLVEVSTAQELQLKYAKNKVNVASTNLVLLIVKTALSLLRNCDKEDIDQDFALMPYSSSNSDSKVTNDSTCSKSYLETVELLKSQNEQLLKDLKKSELWILSYKTRDIKKLKWEIQVGEISISELRKKLEKVQKEKDGIQFNIENFENASKSLDKLIECQIVENCKKGLSYNVSGNFLMYPRVLGLEKTKTSQQSRITSLEKMVKKLERRKKSRSHGLKRLYKVGLTARIESSEEEDLGEDASKQGRINDIDADANITLVSPFVNKEDIEMKLVTVREWVIQKVEEAVRNRHKNRLAQMISQETGRNDKYFQI
ncbi:hypothetical protein Tco_1129514, partial [Tanacetum coccineum]